jgi:hypothetical protein
MLFRPFLNRRAVETNELAVEVLRERRESGACASRPVDNLP